jgi:hypothetical protein
LPLIGVLGTGYWFCNAVLLRYIRHVLDVVNSAGRFDDSLFTNPGQIAVGALASIGFMIVVAILQVEEPGIPSGLTLKGALLPVAFIGVLTVGNTPSIQESSGSATYAGLIVAIYCATTLGSSLLMRRLRAKT